MDEYIRICAILAETYMNGDSKRGNSEGKKIVKLFKLLEKNPDLAINSLPLLFSCNNPVTRTKAAAECISLNICVDEAKKVLEDIANSGEPIIGLNAEMTLKMWKEQGYIKVYPTQEVRCVPFPSE